MSNESPQRPRGPGGGDGPPGEPRERSQRSLFVGALLVGVLVLLFFGAQDGVGKPFGQGPLELIEFEKLLRKNEVAEVRFKDTQAYVTLRPGDLSGKRDSLNGTVNFSSPDAALRIEKLISELAEERQITTRVYTERTNALLYQVLIWFLPTLLLIGALYFFLFRQMRGPGGPGSIINFGKSRHRIVGDKADVTLKDVAGIEEARQDIEEIIAFLKNPEKFSRLGGRMPKGVLLVGPPGTGKTLLAKATAGEAGVPFFSVSGSDFVEMFVGVGASRVRDLFEKAKENSPCIIFLDEVDAVGRQRGSGLGGGHDEREQTLNQILVEMDGFDTDKGIIIMAATNRPDILDPALLRPGRFDRQVVIGLPNQEAREKILRVHARNKKLALDVDLKVLARATPTFSGAELEALLNEAALAAAVRGGDSITMADLEEARDKVRWGRQKRSWKMLEEELKATAYHEAGHALVAAVVDGCDPLHKVTIIPRGRALGLTMSLPEQDQYSLSRKQILARIAMAFGGRIAERLFTDDLSTGAANDIEQATNLARKMVTEWGMSELGPIKFAASDSETVFIGREMGRSSEHSQDTLQKIDAEVARILDEQYKLAERVILEHRDALERVAAALIERETISGSDVRDLIDGKPLPPQPEPREAAPAAGGDAAAGEDASGGGDASGGEDAARAPVAAVAESAPEHGAGEVVSEARDAAGDDDGRP
ncbi:MAG: ATP-dependent zinc metalloprotease FtsH [Planctomycetota bacterium]|nr:MAG: ATP-dependent zinc metalloprotease FtsH [Planctomycetota bacterium]